MMGEGESEVIKAIKILHSAHELLEWLDAGSDNMSTILQSNCAVHMRMCAYHSIGGGDTYGRGNICMIPVTS